MKDYFLFFLYPACSVFSSRISPFSVIDCIIPRVRYLYLCQFLISIVATPNP